LTFSTSKSTSISLSNRDAVRRLGQRHGL